MDYPIKHLGLIWSEVALERRISKGTPRRFPQWLCFLIWFFLFLLGMDEPTDWWKLTAKGKLPSNPKATPGHSIKSNHIHLYTLFDWPKCSTDVSNQTKTTPHSSWLSAFWKTTGSIPSSPIKGHGVSTDAYTNINIFPPFTNKRKQYNRLKKWMGNTSIHERKTTARIGMR